MAVTGVSTSGISSIGTSGQKFRNVKGPATASGVVALGGDEIRTIGNTKYHVFTSPTTTTFTITSNVGLKPVEILVVGGGGGGGRGYGGGGGGGEIDLFASQILTAGSYTVTVGALGSGSTDMNVKGANGGQSQFIGASTITALGGGGGGSSGSKAGANGGSGGGGCQGAAGTASGSNTNAGGSGANGGANGGGGGGGATGTGSNGTTTVAGNGGAGYALSTIDANLTSANFTSLASMTHLSAGGGGGTYQGGTAGAGGSSGQGGAGGTAGANSPGGNAVSFGSGGGSCSYQTDYANGGNGKAGVVIVKYAA